eukprot:COSAG06_NODE_80_length_25388_cov_33.371545_21_plen_92_part_00
MSGWKCAFWLGSNSSRRILAAICDCARLSGGSLFRACLPGMLPRPMATLAATAGPREAGRTSFLLPGCSHCALLVRQGSGPSGCFRLARSR